MWRTKIVVRSSTTEAEVLRALPASFDGRVTLEEQDERDKRVGCQVCIIHHSCCIDSDKVYENLGIELGGAIRLPLFLLENLHNQKVSA